MKGGERKKEKRREWKNDERRGKKDSKEAEERWEKGKIGRIKIQFYLLVMFSAPSRQKQLI